MDLEPRSKFAIFSAGFFLWDSHVRKVAVGGAITTPNLHTFGKRDSIVMKHSWQRLVDWCKDARVELHDGGMEVFNCTVRLWQF